ncbi:MAG: metallophosphoesterase family protein [Chloroflexota bacterium]
MTDTIKIGVLSDIHGDLVGLKKAAAIFESQQVKGVLCLGDLVDRGPNPNDVVAWIRRHEVVCIKGNHEHSLLDNQSLYRQSVKSDSYQKIGRLLSEETVAYLNALPEIRTLTIRGQHILMAHGTPWSDILGVFPDSRATTLQRLFRDYAANIILLGHTHQPMVIKAGNRTILNPGSVYDITQRDSGTCACLTLPAGVFQVFDLKSQKVFPIQPRYLSIPNG